MSKISEIFAQKKPLITYITAGDPNLKTTLKLCRTLAGAGADIIELGIPFSDSLADGPVIQDSHHRAIKAGATLAKIIELVRKNRKRIKVPLIFMSAANLPLAYGLKIFFEDIRTAGVDGLIIPDLPPEEAKDFIKLSGQYGIDLIFLASTESSAQRLQLIAQNSKAFIYLISSPGITGERQELPLEKIRDKISQLKKIAEVPVAVGFGISTPEQALDIFGVADGVIIGSAVVKRAVLSVRAAGQYVKTIIKKADKK